MGAHCSTPESKTEEIVYLRQHFSFNGYQSLFVDKTLLERPAGTAVEKQSPWRAIPHIANLSETETRLVKPYGFGVARRPVGTLHNQVMRIKDRADPSECSLIVHRAHWKEFPCNYTLQTSWKLAIQLKEH